MEGKPLTLLDYLIHLVERLGHWGYAIIFLIVMLECQPGLGLFMPAETLIVMGGFFAAQGQFDLDALIALIAVAAIIGDSIGYEMGRHFGRAWLLRWGRWLGVHEAQLDRVEAFFARHGGKSIFLGHFMHFLRALVPFMAGASRMHYGRFVFFNALGCILWSTVFTLLGYFFGANWHYLEKWIGRASAIIGGMVLLLCALAWLWLWRWLVRNEDDLKEQCHAFLEYPRVAGFRRQFAPQIQFLQNRLSPKGYLGLHLTVGALLIIAASWSFGGIVEDLLTGDPLTVIDLRVAAWFHDRATEGLTQAALAITFFGSLAFLGSASLAIALWLTWRRRWHWLLAFVLTMGGGTLLV